MNRADGYRVRSDKAMYQIVPYIMPTRLDASNNIRINFDLDPIQGYTRKCRKEGIAVSHMAVIIAAYLRTAAKYPYLNRFCVNKKIYARNHFCVSFVTLTGDDSTVCKVYLNLDDTIFDVNEKINKAIEEARADKDTSMDKLAGKLLKIPGLMSFGVMILKGLDRMFSMPFKAIDASPFHTSLFVTNLGSIRTNAIYHHLYNFGTTGIFISVGQPMRETFINDDGSAEDKKVIELCITTDERIADGHYYAKAFHEIKKYMANPELLETRPEKIYYDPDVKKKNPRWHTPEGKSEMPKCIKEIVSY